MRQHFTSTDHACRSLMTALKCRLIRAWTPDNVYLRNESGEPRSGYSFRHFFRHFAKYVSPSYEVRSQNKDGPTAYDIHHNISQNQRSGLLRFVSILETILLTDLLVLYSISKNDIHPGKWRQGLPQRLIHNIEAIITLYNYSMW